MSQSVTIDQLSIRLGEFALDNISLNIDAGSYAILTGKSGSGKSTLLECLCGLRRFHQGTIRIGEKILAQFESGKRVKWTPPALRAVSYMPQDIALFPHLNVREQIGFALEVRKYPKDAVRTAVESMAETLQIPHLLDRKPDHLSGGEAQRVALGRALIARPQLLCLDEPLAALDADTHTEMCQLLQHLHKQTGTTVLHITHNPQEATLLGDTHLTICNGRIESANYRPLMNANTRE